MQEKIKEIAKILFKRDIDTTVNSKLYHFYFIMILIISIIGNINFTNSNFIFAIISYACILLMLLFLLLARKKPRISIWGLMITFIIILTYYFLCGQNSGVAVLWIIIVPACFAMLTNSYYSFIISIYFLILTTTFCYTPLRNYLISYYSIEFLDRFPLIYLTSFLVSLITSYHNQKYNILQSSYLNNLNNDLLKERNKYTSNIYESFTLLALTLDKKDKYKKDHSYHVAEISKQIAITYGLSEQQVNRIYLAALLHDIGKAKISDKILFKESALTKEEQEILETHTILGYKLLENHASIDNEIKDAILYHHERYDGKGYPDGLRGSKIPIAARIIAVADALDAMSNSRSYREKLNKSAIKKQLIDNAGSQFDSNIVQVVINLINGNVIKL